LRWVLWNELKAKLLNFVGVKGGGISLERVKLISERLRSPLEQHLLDKIASAGNDAGACAPSQKYAKGVIARFPTYRRAD